MNRKSLAVLSMVVLVAACSGSDMTQPPRTLGISASAISDGTTPGGNTDFWFLPSMVDDPSGNPLFLNNGFNASLTPTVTITRLTSPGGVVLAATDAALSGEHYQLNWQVPTSSESQTYRVSIMVGTEELGYADVFASSSSAELKTAANDVVALKDGRTLPIKFVIENFALCETPGTGSCSSETVNTTEGGTVETDDGGVTIPPQPNGEIVIVTVEDCPDIPTDLPIKSNCIRVTTDPELTTPLTFDATVWVCENIPATPTPQEERYTMYRYDAPNTTTALPHADDECDPPPPPPPSFSLGASVKGMFADLVRGNFRSAGRQLATLVGPRTLYATTMLDVGAGGFTDEFSDFQLVYPAKLEIVASTNNQAALAGSTLPVNPQVKVTDLKGVAVQNARVRFAATQAACEALPAGDGELSDVNGFVSTPWTLSSTHGANSLYACGRGLAGTNINGPRTSGPDAYDPFQPIQESFDGLPLPSGTLGAVTVATGSVGFSATGQGDFEAGDPAGWTSTGFWHRSSLLSAPSTPIVNSAFIDGLVLAPGGGAMPAPFAGSFVEWYGVEADGNYIGTRAASNPLNGGGTSTAANSGTLTTSSFKVPANTSLRFASWFEIEAFDGDRFDLMSVSIEVIGGPTTLLGRLNPTTDPNGAPNEPYTSGGGVNVTPVWVTIGQDLSGYAGQTVRLRFDFDTQDVLYNGFRGWLVDHLRLEPNVSLAVGGVSASVSASGSQGLNPPQPLTARSP